MNNIEEEKIENFLKDRVAHMHVPREPFDNVVKSVTNPSLRRNRDTKVPEESVPSPYQLTYYKFMKKIAYIGIPIVVVALVAIVALHKPDTEVAYQGTESGGQTQTFNKDSSVDSIVASFDADADADASAANAESEDDQALQSDLQNYNDLKTYDYANN